MASDKKTNSAKSAREAASAARAQALIEERKRERKIRLIGAVVVLAVIGGMSAVVVVNGKNKGPAVVANATLPTGVTKDTYGVKVGSAWTAANADSIPMLQIWEDFQCPACGQFEENSGAAINALVDAGKLRVEYRPTIFLDQSLKSENLTAGNPNSSLLATMAFGCAVDAGKGAEFHSEVFKVQPAVEGVGFSIETLTQAATAAGVSGAALDTFSSCLTDKTYEAWVNNSYDLFSKEGVSSTPTGILNGKELTGDTLFDPAALTKAIEDAAKTQ